MAEDEEKEAPAKRNKKVSPRKSMFAAAGFPYLFTLIVAFISFQYNQITDEIKDSPFMQYRIELDSTISGKNADTDYYTCSVENICKSRFKSLQFVFTYQPEELRYRQFMTPVIEPVHPAALHGFSDTLAAGGIAAIFGVTNFQPETSYKFHFQVTHPVKKILDPYMYVNAGENVVLKQPSLFTWCIRNQLPINGIIMLFLFAVLAIYFIYLNNSHYEDQAD